MTARIICRLFVLLFATAGWGLAQVAIPDTPAGHTLRVWMDAFNSGDRARIEAYVKTTPSQAASLRIDIEADVLGSGGVRL